MRSLLATVRTQLSLPGQLQPLTRPARVQLVPQIRAQMRMITLWRPGTTPQLTGDCGSMHPHTARDLRPRQATIKPPLDLDSVFKSQMAVLCD